MPLTNACSDFRATTDQQQRTTQYAWPTDVGSVTGKVVLVLETSIGLGDLYLRAFSVDTGTEMWKVSAVRQVCAVGKAQVSVLANDQLVLLDRQTGKQLAYSAVPNACDHVAGGFTFNRDGKVYKLVDAYR